MEERGGFRRFHGSHGHSHSVSASMEEVTPPDLLDQSSESSVKSAQENNNRQGGFEAKMALRGQEIDNLVQDGQMFDQDYLESEKQHSVLKQNQQRPYPEEIKLHATEVLDTKSEPQIINDDEIKILQNKNGGMTQIQEKLLDPLGFIGNPNLRKVKPQNADLEFEIEQDEKQSVQHFSKEEDFVHKFNEELKVNKSFDRIQKFVQQMILQDQFIMRIIINSAQIKDDKALLDHKRQLKGYNYNQETADMIRELNYKNTRGNSQGSVQSSGIKVNQNQRGNSQGTVQGSGVVRTRNGLESQGLNSKSQQLHGSQELAITQNNFSSGKRDTIPKKPSNLLQSPEKAILQEILSASKLLGGQSLSADFESIKQHQLKTKRSIFAMRSEDIFDIVYALISQIFLNEIDTVNTLAYDLKRRFGTDWIEHKAKDDQGALSKHNISEKNLQIARKGFSLQNNNMFSKQLSAPVTDFRYKNDKNSPSKLPSDTKDQGTQTGGIQEDIIKMCSIYGIDIDKLFLPGENEKFLSSLLSKKQKFIQLHHIDTKNKKLLKIKISQQIKQDKSMLVRQGSVDTTIQSLKQIITGDKLQKKMSSINDSVSIGSHSHRRKEEKKGQSLVTNSIIVEVEEYVPNEAIQQLLPFGIYMKMKHLKETKAASIVDFDLQKEMNNLGLTGISVAGQNQGGIKSQFGNTQSWQWLKVQKEDEKRFSKFDIRENIDKKILETMREKNKRLASSQGNKMDKKLIQKSLGIVTKESECVAILNEYHQCLNEATERYPTRNINMKYLTYLAKENKRNVDNEFSQLPPQHQKIINQMLNQTLEMQINEQRYLQLEMDKKMEQLKKFELQLDRLNEKVRAKLNHLQEIDVRKNIMKNEDLWKKFLKISQTEAFVRNCLVAKGMLTQAHSDGFQLGLIHGKFLGAQIEKSLVLAQGQLNGVKHGWISGFEAGQASGIRKTFIDCYMMNINLFEKMDESNHKSSVLDNINIRDLKKERLNEYFKNFSLMRSSKIKQKDLQFKSMLQAFQNLRPHERLKFKRFNRRKMELKIQEVYSDFVLLTNQSQKESPAKKSDIVNTITIIDAIMNQISYNYGQTKVTDDRMFKILTSANLLTTSHERRHDFERQLFYQTNIKNYRMSAELREKLVASEMEKLNKDLGSLKKMRMSYQTMHFVKFLQINESSSNFSLEIFKFYIDILMKLKDQKAQLQPGKKVDQSELINRIKVSYDHTVDVVIFWRVEQVLHQCLKAFLPEDIFNAFKKNIETALEVTQPSKPSLHWIDMHKLLDQSMIMYQRFNRLHEQSTLAQIYYAWTLFSVDTLDFDQIYLTLKLMMPKAKQIITFSYPQKNQTIFKKIREVMQNVHDRFSVSLKEDLTQRDVQNDFTDLMNAVGGFDQAEFSQGQETEKEAHGHFVNFRNDEKDSILKIFQKMHQKIRKNSQDFKYKSDLFVNAEEFHKIFSSSDVHMTQIAKKIFEDSKQFIGKRDANSLQKDDFHQRCEVRLQKLRNRLYEMCKQIQKTEKYSQQAFKFVKQMKSEKFDQQKELIEHGHRHGASDENLYAQNPDLNTFDEHFEYALDGQKKKTKNVLSQEFRQIARLDIDLKPYLPKQSMKTWELRVTRLEQKAKILSPKIVALSFELYELALDLLSKKIQKYLRHEERLLEIIKENHQGHCHSHGDTGHNEQEEMALQNIFNPNIEQDFD